MRTSGKPGSTITSSLAEDGNDDKGIEHNDGNDEENKSIHDNINRNASQQNRKNITIIKPSNKKLVQALNLPTVMNVNPRSIYNKKNEFHTFVEEEEIDCVFMSESWERPDMPLDQIINLPNHVVISNPHQRKGVGGRPALIINQSKYHVRNLTQSLIEIPWGVEAT